MNFRLRYDTHVTNLHNLQSSSRHAYHYTEYTVHSHCQYVLQYSSSTVCAGSGGGAVQQKITTIMHRKQKSVLAAVSDFGLICSRKPAAAAAAMKDGWARSPRSTAGHGAACCDGQDGDRGTSGSLEDADKQQTVSQGTCRK